MKKDQIGTHRFVEIRTQSSGGAATTLTNPKRKLDKQKRKDKQTHWTRATVTW
jgi:hypothetical protein